FATFIGSISAATLSYDTSGRLYNQKMDELKDYMKWKNVSDDTRHKLISYYETKYRGKYFEEDSLLADMNDSLRTEVSLHNTRKLIEQVPFLRRAENDGRDEIFFGRIAAALHACYFTPGDCITKQGDSGLDMFFILQGKVNVLINDVKVASLYDGAYIGEVALVTKTLRTATVQAAMPSVLYRLTCEDFNKILGDFADMKIKIDNLARNGGKTLDKMKKLSGM
ncbi:UNVERIFIED_CONTAM: Potassium voltage-gated channel sub H member 7, partial [Siphonaria sp. JEL0065]